MNKCVAIRMFIDKDDQSKLNVYNSNGNLYCIDKENRVHKLRAEKHSSYVEEELRELAIKHNLREVGTRVVDIKILNECDGKEYNLVDYLDQI